MSDGAASDCRDAQKGMRCQFKWLDCMGLGTNNIIQGDTLMMRFLWLSLSSSFLVWNTGLDLLSFHDGDVASGNAELCCPVHSWMIHIQLFASSDWYHLQVDSMNRELAPVPKPQSGTDNEQLDIQLIRPFHFKASTDARELCSRGHSSALDSQFSRASAHMEACSRWGR